jgi:tetratricopeptide (TPR) repeat protein
MRPAPAAALSVWLLLGCAAPALAADVSAGALDAARALLYNARYAEAAELAQALDPGEEQLDLYELRTSAILFQVRRAVGDGPDPARAFKRCATCPELLHAFQQQYSAGRSAARAALKERPNDPTVLFFLGKLDLNYLWLTLGTIGRRTGWDEYWEARRSLDAALAARPGYLRARVARAWIDYIVDTKMPWGTGWLLGGGNRKRALSVMREAAESEDGFYDTAEARFGLWEMLIRERQFTEALQSAHRLADMFPENPEVARFIATRRP